MIIHSVVKLEEFDFWGGAVANAGLLTSSEFAELEDNLNELYPYGMEDIALNDLFWFEFGQICEWLGLNEDEVRERDIDC